jgi:hypothetical protein
LLAENATGTEILNFPAKEIYHMVVAITGLIKPGQTLDFTRNGVAIGFVVVPEFPGFHSTSLVMALMIGSLNLVQNELAIDLAVQNER